VRSTDGIRHPNTIASTLQIQGQRFRASFQHLLRRGQLAAALGRATLLSGLALPRRAARPSWC
jgi:hypothetical protein